MTDNTTTMARRTIYRSTTQKLTDGMRQFLERQPFAMLATYNPNGSIHVVPLSYIFEDGRFFFATSSSSRKARNLVARPEATVTVDDRSTLEWVSATGTAELIRGQRSGEINARLYHRSWTDAGLEAVKPEAEAKGEKLPPPLSREQIGRVRELALEKGRQLRLSPDQAGLLADSLAGSLATTE